MADKAYIVANEEQEREVLEQFENQGYIWFGGGGKPTEWTPTHKVVSVDFPYALIDDGELSWCYIHQIDNEEIVFDGRKESEMSNKYVVSQTLMNELNEWVRKDVDRHVVAHDLYNTPDLIRLWWLDPNVSGMENNNRLIAIIRLVNGEDVFEVEKSKKWIVHELNTELYVTTYDGHTGITPNWDYITKFGTKEEAQSWANAHQEVIEVEE